MANYFVSSADGDDTDDGATMDNGSGGGVGAWATVEHAYEAGGLSAGDFVFTRPNHSEIPTSDIAPIYSGAAGSFITVLGWPKPAFSITSATWTNGSTTVDLVLPATLTRTGHVGRMILAPNGFIYFITYIVDSNTFLIDRAYSGDNVSGVSGAATIAADPYYNMAQAIDDSSWTIKKTDWNANNPARPVVGFNDGNFQLFFDDTFNWLQGFEVKDSADAYGIIQINIASGMVLFGNIIKQTTNNSCLLNIARCNSLIEECIIEGSGSGSAQVGIFASRYIGGGGELVIKKTAIYNCGGRGIENSKLLFLDNVNIGVEQANGDDEIRNIGLVLGKDVKLDGTNGYVSNHVTYGGGTAHFENYQKVLGNHRGFFRGGYYQNVAVSGETPNKKVSDEVIKITPNVSGLEFIPEMAYYVFEDEWNNVPAGTYNIGYWIFNDSGVTLNVSDPKLNIWLEVEYLAEYDDTSEYVHAKIYSTLQDIADAANADDWDKLVTGNFTTAATSKIRAKVYFSKYLAATNVFIDTKETEN